MVLIEYKVNGNYKCWIWHNYVERKSNGFTTYYACMDCPTRKVTQATPNYQPFDWNWLEGKTNDIKD